MSELTILVIVAGVIWGFWYELRKLKAQKAKEHEFKKWWDAQQREIKAEEERLAISMRVTESQRKWRIEHGIADEFDRCTSKIEDMLKRAAEAQALGASPNLTVMEAERFPTAHGRPWNEPDSV